MTGLEGAQQYVTLLGEMGEFHYRWVDPWSMVNWRSLIIAVHPSISSESGSVLVLLLGGATITAFLLVWRGPWPGTAGVCTSESAAGSAVDDHQVGGPRPAGGMGRIR